MEQINWKTNISITNDKIKQSLDNYLLSNKFKVIESIYRYHIDSQYFADFSYTISITTQDIENSYSDIIISFSYGETLNKFYYDEIIINGQYLYSNINRIDNILIDKIGKVLDCVDTLEERYKELATLCNLDSEIKSHQNPPWKIRGSNGINYTDLQLAIDEVYNFGGGEIWIAKGTYKHGMSLNMKNNVAIYGGFDGTETSKDQRVAGNNTILDGEGKYRVFYNNYTEENPLTNSAKLDNVTIQNGYVSNGNDNSESTANYGAGIYNYYANPVITNCTFSNNRASGTSDGYGGGMYNYFSSPELTNCTFNGNSADSGGAMYNWESSSPVLTNCTFSNNSASNFAGGMYNFAFERTCSPVLTNCTFSGNSAGDGGAMHNDGVFGTCNPVLTNCTFSNNSANYGGGIDNYGSEYGTCNPVLTNCTFSNNSAYNGGAMHNDCYSSPVLTNCTFVNNIAESFGGVMYNYGYYFGTCNPVLTNCTITNNSAKYDGGVMYNYGCDHGTCNPVLTNCTITNNSASYGSGGVMYNKDISNPELTNCILWDNTAKSKGNDIYNDNSNNKPTIDTCIIQNGKSGIYNIDYCTFTTEPIITDPKLMSLGNYGGSVQTIAVEAGSSAIKAGKVIEGLTTDARGIARSKTAPTIGAYEYVD